MDDEQLTASMKAGEAVTPSVMRFMLLKRLLAVKKRKFHPCGFGSKADTVPDTVV